MDKGVMCEESTPTLDEIYMVKEAPFDLCLLTSLFKYKPLLEANKSSLTHIFIAH